MKVITAKNWDLTPAADGRRYSKYPDGTLPAADPAVWNLPATISVNAGTSVGVRQYVTNGAGWSINVTGLVAGLSYNSGTESIDATAGAATGSTTATFTLSKTGETDVVATTTVGAVAVVTGQPRDFTPGHYMDTDVLERLGGNNLTQGRVNEIANTPFKGIKQRYYWKTLEPTKNNYDFSRIHAHIGWLQSIGKKLCIQIQDMIFNGPTHSRYAAAWPDYIKNDAEYEGGIIQRYADPERGYAPRSWIPAVQDRRIALMQAIATEFDGNTNVVLVMTEETSGFSGDAQSLLTAAGYTYAKRTSEYKRYADAANVAFTHTPFQMMTNYYDWHGDAGMKELVDYFMSKDIIVGGPDILLKGTDLYTRSQKIIRGTYDATDRRPNVVHANNVEWQTAGSRTIAEIQDAVMNAHQQQMISWVYRTNQIGINWPEIKAWVVANNPPTHTDWRY